MTRRTKIMLIRSELGGLVQGVDGASGNSCLCSLYWEDLVCQGDCCPMCVDGARISRYQIDF